jgi:alkanesulfonate monooxygenase SsuD/methylene tetrahydromethanopterin reductase-like flavin-dependent oxidoreductase (luciferase family)
VTAVRHRRQVRMQFSILPVATQPWRDILDLAGYADAGFWHCIYIADHLMGPSDGPENEVGRLEATATLSALAAATSRIRLANLVLSVTYRHPAVVANWAATVDRISGGRLTLGLGAGWQVNEHEYYGFPLGSPGERVDRFAEALAVITGLLRQPRTTFDGRYYQLHDAPCDPKPLQSPLPVMVGGSGPRMLWLIARYAQGWNHWSAPGQFRATANKLDAACEQVGRDPSTIWRSTQALTLLTRSRDEEERAAAKAAKGRLPVIYGTPQRIADAVATWHDEGVDEVLIRDRPFGTGERRRDAYDALAEALAPLTD